jgi:hypothetical protein
MLEICHIIGVILLSSQTKASRQMTSTYSEIDIEFNSAEVLLPGETLHSGIGEWKRRVV